MAAGVVSGGSGRRISVHDATVKTAAVEVKALTISGKQVTLAVFRQLLEEALLDPSTGEYAGVPWGTVNYHWAECRDTDRHYHVVWQKGEELRRATVLRSWPGSYQAGQTTRRLHEKLREAEPWWFAAAVLDGRDDRLQPAHGEPGVWRATCLDGRGNAWTYTRTDAELQAYTSGTYTQYTPLGEYLLNELHPERTPQEKIDYRQTEKGEPPPAGDGWKASPYTYGQGTQWRRDRLETPDEVAARLTNHLKALRASLERERTERARNLRAYLGDKPLPDDPGRYVAGLQTELRDHIQDTAQKAARWDERWAEVEALDQLFIAV